MVFLRRNFLNLDGAMVHDSRLLLHGHVMPRALDQLSLLRGDTPSIRQDFRYVWGTDEDWSSHTLSTVLHCRSGVVLTRARPAAVCQDSANYGLIGQN